MGNLAGIKRDFLVKEDKERQDYQRVTLTQRKIIVMEKLVTIELVTQKLPKNVKFGGDDFFNLAVTKF